MVHTSNPQLVLLSKKMLRGSVAKLTSIASRTSIQKEICRVYPFTVCFKQITTAVNPVFSAHSVSKQVLLILNTPTPLLLFSTEELTLTMSRERKTQMHMHTKDYTLSHKVV